MADHSTCGFQSDYFHFQKNKEKYITNAAEVLFFMKELKTKI